MSTYATPEPISVTVDLALGTVKLIASDRTDTVVTVEPSDPANDASVQAAQRVRVDHVPGSLNIRQSTSWRQKVSRTAQIGTVAVTVELPSGSRVQGRAALGTVQSEGRLGGFEFTLDGGGVRLDEVTGDLRIKVTTGDIAVGCAHADVNAQTTTGSIRVGEVVRGRVVLITAIGEIEIGVREGSAANLDLHTRLGRVRNTLNGVSDPDQFAETVRIRADTNLDDIIVRRS